jgi:hypothetical protein
MNLTHIPRSAKTGLGAGGGALAGGTGLDKGTGGTAARVGGEVGREG